MLIFVPAFATDVRRRANLPARGHAVQESGLQRDWGAELGRALPPALAAATNSDSNVYGITKRGTALG
jgi:hypothetical protein